MKYNSRSHSSTPISQLTTKETEVLLSFLIFSRFFIGSYFLVIKEKKLTNCGCKKADFKFEFTTCTPEPQSSHAALQNRRSRRYRTRVRRNGSQIVTILPGSKKIEISFFYPGAP
jgi:hypothetical protein